MANADDAEDAGEYIELPESDGAKQNCVSLVVGAAREEAQLCDEIDFNYWTVTRQFVRVVRAGKRVRVLDLVTKIEAVDSGDKWMELRLRIASDGMSATTLNGVPSKLSNRLVRSRTATAPHSGRMVGMNGCTACRRMANCGVDCAKGAASTNGKAAASGTSGDELSRVRGRRQRATPFG